MCESEQQWDIVRAVAASVGLAAPVGAASLWRPPAYLGLDPTAHMTAWFLGQGR
jgi:hypothetical protein